MGLEPASGSEPGGGTVRRGAGARHLDLYFLVGAIVVVLLAVQTVQRQWSTDYWMHDAVVGSVSRDPLDPTHPLVGSDDPSEYHSPYTVGLGAVARLGSLAPVTVLQIAAIANLVLFLVAFRLFVVALTGRRRVALLALAATLVCWGPRPWRWSGFLNLNSIGFGLPYPAMLATGLALFVGWAWIRYATARTNAFLAVVAIGVAIIVVVHPFTGLWTIVMLAALAPRYGLIARDRLGPVAIAGASTVALVALWPYYSFFGLAGATGEFSGAHDALYEDLPFRLAAALPGYAMVGWRVRRDRLDPLGLMVLGALTVYVLGAVTGNHNLGRVLPLLVLPAHIGFGELVDRVLRRPSRHRVVGAWIGVSVVVGLVGIAPGLLRMVPRVVLPASVADREALAPLTDRYEALTDALPAGSVAVVELKEARMAAPASGVFTVAPGYATAFVDDADARHAASAAVLDPTTSASRRDELLTAYDVDAVICSTAECEALLPGRRTTPAGDLTVVWTEASD